MKLHFGPTSPFARKVRIVAIETGIADRVELVRARAHDADTDLGNFNPLVKVPALTLDDGAPLYDSAVICEYFDTLHSGPKVTPEGPERWQVLRRTALADGITEAFIAWGAEDRRPGAPEAAERAARQKTKIDNAYAALDAELDTFKDTPVRLDSIAVACAFGYMEIRKPDWGWKERHPALAAWFEAYKARPAMKETFAEPGT